MNKKEGNLISFKVVVDSKGYLATEISGVPEDKVSTIFKGHDLKLIRRILAVCNDKLKPLHKEIEAELQALNHPTT